MGKFRKKENLQGWHGNVLQQPNCYFLKRSRCSESKLESWNCMELCVLKNFLFVWIFGNIYGKLAGMVLEVTRFSLLFEL